MGMYDEITGVPPLACRKCGAPITGWQSKDAYCTMDQIPFWEVGTFYAACANPNCRQWHQYELKRPVSARPFSDYELLPPHTVKP